ncbi:MAG: DNA-processing protein DprA [Pseudomonadota bacterium]|nr:DNA-processing protein DprA [Pseudomonadota bacterium]MBU1184560.1 DNA-processing protein DprA [Pseudomonadota bacterium]MBU2234780.1 DNA-processing protein DprA [Pseudomonadota bacterium]MBU4120118.1 DNA-processing protein DprA [Pseudomonadota bacterium]
MDEDTLKYWIALKAVEEVGCVGFRTLLKAFSSPKAVFSASAQTLKVIPGIGPKTADHIRAFSDWGMAEREVALAGKLGIAIVTFEDPLYPKNLLNIYDFPPFLYVKGSLCPEEIPVAVVGSRVASAYGRYTTERLSRELALKGITIVSGLARGIDAAAHRGALAGKGRTIAVLGCGLDVIYPPENEKLADDITARGALVTEFPFGTPPNAPNFPARNRIISGISFGVVVVEAGEKSGSLITARLAAEQGRSVFAVPGAIDTAGSRGTNRLIKQGAKLIENVDDILEEILPQTVCPPVLSEKQPRIPMPDATQLDPETMNAPPAADIAGLGETERKLFALVPQKPVEIDTLIITSGFAPQEVLNGLLILELRGLIRQLPGKMFVRKESTI